MATRWLRRQGRADHGSGSVICMYATNSSGAPAGDTNTWASKHILLYLACNSCPTNCLFFSNSVECLLSNAVYVCSLSEDCKLMREQWLHRVIPAHTD